MYQASRSPTLSHEFYQHKYAYMPKFNLRTRKGRSALQKAHTKTLPYHRTAQLQDVGDPEPKGMGECGATSTSLRVEMPKKNKPLEILRKHHKNALQREKRAKSKITKLEGLINETYIQLSASCKAQDYAEHALRDLQAQANVDAREILILQTRVHQLEQEVSNSSQDILAVSMELEEERNQRLSLQQRHQDTQRSRDTFRKRAQRMMQSIKQGSLGSVDHSCDKPQFHLKDQARVIRPEIRDMLRKLACQGVPTERASDIIDIVAEGLGLDVLDTISARSVGRIMLEGLVQACMQLAQELSEANSISICGDGTSIKNQQHEARAIYVRPPVPSTNQGSTGIIEAETPNPIIPRTLGVHKAASHTAQKQLEGWINAINRCCDVLNRSPQGPNRHVDSHTLAPKLRGVLTDHAADQKRLHELLQEWKQRCDREARAVHKLKTMTVSEQLQALSEYLDNATTSMSDWRVLPSDQQAALMHDAWFALAIKTGETEFQKLSQNEQFDIDFLAWAGCCMHKELNAVKGGVANMALAWEANGLKRPIPLYNKFDAEKSIQNHDEKAPRGGPKLARIAGALLRNKDDKKGYQKSVDNYFETVFGYSNRFPDISSTRYGSYCDAATELIIHLNTYIKLLETLRDAKFALEFTNIESNLFQGLHDIPTLTELAVMALYAQAIGRPYLRIVRSTKLNALDLGAFHERVKQHCRAIIENPDLLLGQDASAEKGTLDGGIWDRPELIYCILWMSPKLPDLRAMVVAFFKGALETWERFTSEFNEGGIIARATQEQRDTAWVNPTNDISEGLLGQCRQMLRRAPTMTDEQLNARLMWSHNGTYDWAKRTLTDTSTEFVRQEARNIDASGANRKLRIEFTAALEARAASNRERQAKAIERRSEVKRKLDRVQLIENATYEDLYAMKVKDLDLQIDKLREAGNPYIRAKSTIGTKAAKIQEILACLERRRGMAGIYDGTNINESSFMVTSGGKTGEDEIDMYFDDEVVL